MHAEEITLEGDTVTVRVITLEEVVLDSGQLPGPPAQFVGYDAEGLAIYKGVAL